MAEKPGLSRADEKGRPQSDLDRMLSDKLMAQADAGSALTRDFEAAVSLSLPTFADVESRLKQAISAPDMSSEFELPSLGDITVTGIKLNELLGGGGGSIEERSILKRGLLFMKKRMNAEAVEWWTLNRPKDHILEARFYCLLTLLLALTLDIAGDKERAQAAKEEALQIRKLVK